MLKAPQHTFPTNNLIHAGMLARTIFIQAGADLIGAVHRTDHINICIGDITVSTDAGMQRLTGYNVLPTRAGMKRIGRAHADTMWTTICRTDLTDLTAIEDSLVEDSHLLQTRQQELPAPAPLTLIEV